MSIVTKLPDVSAQSRAFISVDSTSGNFAIVDSISNHCKYNYSITASGSKSITTGLGIY